MKTLRLNSLSTAQLVRLVQRNPLQDEEITATCRDIFRQVEREGDAALSRLSRRFDGVAPQEFAVPQTDIDRALDAVGTETRQALQEAARNIRRFHSAQRRREAVVETVPGVRCWREHRPIARVGLYVPAGNAPLPSTVLMLGVPARLAGCSEIALASPPRKDGTVADEILAAASVAGISRIYRVGGAQAIAAFTLGTNSIPRVDKIFGPGNRWVQGAKLLSVGYGTAIDLPAGPSEVLVVADETSRAEFVAADLLSQAEHGPDSRAVLVTPSASLAQEVARTLDKRLQGLPRSSWAEEALINSFTLICPDLDAALDFSNRYAPEHLILHFENAQDHLQKVASAGSVFVGPWSPETAGDYASGTNHTLPTSGAARAYSGVSLESFFKTITFQELSPEGLDRLSPTLLRLAQVEGLQAHKEAVEVRRQALSDAAEEPRSLRRKRLELLLRTSARGLRPYCSARDQALDGILLDANEHPFPSTSLGTDLNRYPDPNQGDLRRALARANGVEFEQVLAGTGSDEVLDWIFKAFLDPGRDALTLFEPTYGMYRVLADLYDIEVHQERLNASFDLDAQTAIEAAPGHVKAVFLCSPNNPTGNPLDAAEILKLCQARNWLVVVDEAYVEFAESPSLKEHLGDFPNLVLLRTLSKAYGLAGIRLGYAIADPLLIEAFRLVKAPYNLSALTVHTAIDSLRLPPPHLEELKCERRRLHQALRQVEGVQEVFPSQANFLLFRCRQARRVQRELLRDGIVIRDRSSLPGLTDCLRVSVGLASENDLFLDRLRHSLHRSPQVRLPATPGVES